MYRLKMYTHTHTHTHIYIYISISALQAILILMLIFFSTNHTWILLFLAEHYTIKNEYYLALFITKFYLNQDKIIYSSIYICV